MKRFFFIPYRISFFLLTCICAASLCCRNAAKPDKQSATGDPVTGMSPEKINPLPDTLVIDRPSAIIFTADSARKEKIRSRLGEGPFDGADHECFYQMKNARTSLQEHWPNVQIVEVNDNRVLLFLKENGSKTVIELNSRQELCGLLLFDGKKEPGVADMMNVGNSLEYYFLR